MKKLLKKASIFLCALAVAIGFVGATVEEASAASKTYSGYVLVTSKMPSWASGEITVSQGSKSVKTGWIRPGGTTPTVRLLGSAKSGQTCTISIKANTSDGTFYTSLKVKASDLAKNKKFTVKFKTSGVGVFKKIKSIYI